MATIASSAKQLYSGGTAVSDSHIVGYSGKNRVVRFTFETDAFGASSVSWYLNDNYSGEGTLPALRWYIGTSATSHANAGKSTTTYHGTVKATENAGTYKFSGSADLVLLPNTTYYLWIFPNTTTSGYYYLTEIRQATLTTAGGAGLVNIYNGSGWDVYLVWIYDGSAWGLYILYIYDGSAWVMYS